jgi:hypothetical protein
MPRLGVHNQYLHILGGKIHIEIHDYPGSDPMGSELHSGIQRTGKIVRDYQKKDHVSPSFLCFYCPTASRRGSCFLFYIIIMAYLEMLCIEKKKKQVTF